MVAFLLHPLSVQAKTPRLSIESNPIQSKRSSAMTTHSLFTIRASSRMQTIARSLTYAASVVALATLSAGCAVETAAEPAVVGSDLKRSEGNILEPARPRRVSLSAGESVTVTIRNPEGIERELNIIVQARDTKLLGLTEIPIRIEGGTTDAMSIRHGKLFQSNIVTTSGAQTFRVYANANMPDGVELEFNALRMSGRGDLCGLEDKCIESVCRYESTPSSYQRCQ
jgi:hypothetical protein